MIRNILHTLGSRFIVSLMNLALLLITTKLMGAENKGQISLLILNLSLASILSGLFGGPSLVYLIPRYPFKSLLSLNYAWSIISAGLITLLSGLGLLPMTTGAFMFFGMALLESVLATNLMVLLGRKRISWHNMSLVLKAGIVVGLLAFHQLNGKTLDYAYFEQSYLIALVVSFSVTTLLLFIQKVDLQQTFVSFTDTIKSSLKYGFLVQCGNIAQLLNYRLSFYFLELMIHPPVEAMIRIGIYSATLQVAEALWQFARSISTVQYSTVSNIDDPKEGLKISLSLGKLNYFVTTVGIVCLLLPGESLYGLILGTEFAEIKHHLYYLAPGVIALSLSNAFSHYFAGVGLHRFNTQSSILGLAGTIAVGYPLIKTLGTEGAAITASIVYIGQTVFQYAMLRKHDNVKFKDLWIKREDLRQVNAVRKKLFKKV